MTYQNYTDKRDNGPTGEWTNGLNRRQLSTPIAGLTYFRFFLVIISNTIQVFRIISDTNDSRSGRQRKRPPVSIAALSTSRETNRPLIKLPMMNNNNSHKIRFERPNLGELIQRYTVVDLHFHSEYSDGNNTVSDIAQRALELGIGIAITDHNEIKGAVAMDKYPDILNIPGIEVTSREGTHLLIYFYDIKGLKKFYRKDIRPHMGSDIMSSTDLEMEEIIDRARAFETLVVFPHPYSATFTGIQNTYFSEKRLEQLYEMVDGVEVINAENLKKWNLRSALLGFNLGKGVTGGSDGHRLPQMGRAVSYAACSKDRRAFLDAVKGGQTRVVGKEIDIIRKVRSNSVKLRTNIKNYPKLVGKNLRYSCSVINSKSKLVRETVRRSFTERIKQRGKKYGLV